MARSSLTNVCRLIKEVANELPPEQQFLADLKRSIEMTANKDARMPSQTYKPSSMNCMRNMYFQRIGQAPDNNTTDYSLVGICNSGSDIHEHIQNFVADMTNNGMPCRYVDVAEFVKSRKLDYLEVIGKQGNETKLFHKNLNMSFLCDGIIQYKKHYYILEIKTESSSKFWQRKNVDPKHYNQGIAYSIALGIPDVIFLYICRDTLNMKSYLFEPTDESKHKLVDMIDRCEQYVWERCVPPMDENMSKQNCNYCGYKNVCRGA